jgi:hypothetical protein
MFRIIGSFLRLAEELALMDSLAQTLRALFISLALGFAALLLFLAAAACGLAALWIWALGPFGPVGAPALVAATILVLSLIMLAAMGRVWNGGARRKSRKAARMSADSAMQPGRLLSAAARGFMVGLNGDQVRR